jgi:hypothetical protein
MRWKSATGLILAAGMLSGCTGEYDIWGMRYGPSPVLVADTVRGSVERQTAVVAAVVAGASGLPRNPATGVPLPPVFPSLNDPDIQGDRISLRRAWYTLILTGFNVIDDACMSYIDGLWIMERQKTRNSTIIHAAGAAGAALLSAQVTSQTAAALLVLSQAFGFAGILNDAVFNTYLYTQNAATIKKLVQRTTAAYRKDFAAKTLSGDGVSYPLASPGAAYHHMREYLALCLPPTIQAQIEVLAGNAIAIPEDLLTQINGAPAGIAASRINGKGSPVTTIVVR